MNPHAMNSRATNPRATAAQVIELVCSQGRSLSQALEAIPDDVQTERPLIQEMSYGVCREYHHLLTILEGLLSKPFKAKDGDVQALLLVGLYQLISMRVPDHAGVSETVSATRDLKKPWARGLVNGVLRTFLREKDLRIQEADQSEPAHWSHPQWLLDHIRAAWPDHWQAILNGNNQRPPMTLRVNLSRISREDYLAELTSLAIKACPGPYAPGAIQLVQPVDVSQLPGFHDGWVSVQDEAAQFAAGLLDLEDGQRILDVCAAPGGKTGHILEMADVETVAIDIDPLRLEKVRQNLDRLGKTATLMTGDATKPEQWWNGQPFDRILLDAPCSATGVIRRHPDIKILRRAEDIQSLVELQARILDAVWPLLKPGGMLLYATCSVLPCENNDQVAAFVDRRSDTLNLEIDAVWGQAVSVGRQILPGDRSNDENTGSMDGFYYSCLKKQP